MPVVPGVALDEVDDVHISASPFAGPPAIRVANDGDAFSHVCAPVSAIANVHVDCKGSNKVEHARLV